MSHRTDKAQSQPLSSLSDEQRLKALYATGLLDTSPSEGFDRFTNIASRLLHVPVSLVSLVDKDRQFFKSQTGLPEPWASQRQTPLSHSFCQYVVDSRETLKVENATEHRLVCDNQAITDLRVKAYLGIPLQTTTGHVLGSFCVIDIKPRSWSDDDTEILREIAIMVMNEIELRNLAKQLQADYQKLRNLEIQRSDLVHMLVHDMRNPLFAIEGGIELLRMDETMPNTSEEVLQLASDGVNNLMILINNALDVQKADTEAIKIDYQDFTANTLVQEALNTMKLHADVSEVAIVAESVCTDTLCADYLKLKRVLVNLIGNAIEHSSADAHVKLSAQRDGDSIVFSVSDEGCGIPQSAFDKIFEKYAQLDNNYKKSAKTGLGLCFSRLVAEAHHGSIWLDSELGSGTSFHVSIPIQAPPKADPVTE